MSFSRVIIKMESVKKFYLKKSNNIYIYGYLHKQTIKVLL